NNFHSLIHHFLSWSWTMAGELILMLVLGFMGLSGQMESTQNLPKKKKKSNVLYSTSCLKTWTDAQSYCREKFIDLVTINDLTLKQSGFKEAWIGLYRESWTWSDNSSFTFSNWNTGQPDYFLQQYCVMLLHGLWKWHDADCGSELPFICLKGEVCLSSCMQTWCQKD
uniref:C-type lectin domain-containing protein n=1 Tax=Lates calcarifer TaxID=8187 RepID=A0A4W6EY71_LATCA